MCVSSQSGRGFGSWIIKKSFAMRLDRSFLVSSSQMKRLSGVFFAITVFISVEVGAWKSYTAVCYSKNGDNSGSLAPAYGDITSECNAISKTEASFQSIAEWNDGKTAVVSEAGSLKVTSVGAHWTGIVGDGSWAWLDGSDFSYCPPGSSAACDDTTNWSGE